MKGILTAPPIPKEELEYINEELLMLHDSIDEVSVFGFGASLIEVSNWTSENSNNESLRN